jgi:predicted metal-dependent hydrolase
MMKEKKRSGTIDRLTEALGNSEHLTLEQVKARLKEEGLDADASFPVFIEKLNQDLAAARRRRLDSAREKRLWAKRTSWNIRHEYGHLSVDELLATLKSLLKSGQPETAVSFRELESLTREDLLTTLEDLLIADQAGEGEVDGQD